MATDWMGSWSGAVDDQLDFGKNIYLESAPQLANSNAASMRMGGLQANQAMQNYLLSQDLITRRKKFDGLEDQYIADANAYGSDANMQIEANKAVADAKSQFANMRSQTGRSMSRMGINPNSGRFAALQGSMAMEEAGALAGAANKARFNTRALADDRKKSALGLGQNIISGAMSAGSLAANTANSAAQNYRTPFANQMSYASGVSGVYDKAIDGYGGLWKSTNLTAQQQAALDGQEDANYWGAIGGVLASKTGEKVLDKGIDFISGLF